MKDSSGFWDICLSITVWIVVLIVVIDLLDETTTIRVQEYSCEGGDCGKGELGSRLKLVLNERTGAGVLEVEKVGVSDLASMDLMKTNRFFEGCVYVDSNNFRCLYGGGKVSLEVLNGRYSRSGSVFLLGYKVQGEIGWRYWVSRMTSFFEGLGK